MGVRFHSGFGHRAQAHRRERLIFVGGTTVMAVLMIIGAIVVYSHSVQASREEIVAVKDDASFGNVVLIAPTSQIPRGGKISTASLREVYWPRDQVPEGAVRTIEDAQGMFAVATLPANQPILRTNISTNPLTFGIQEQLPPGHRAVTIDVDAITGVEGWAQPGAHVDVYLTYVDAKEGKHITRVAVENAVVLSLGGSAKKSNSEEVEKSTMASTVTLAVPFEDSLKIQTAKAMGHITLALRNTNDIASPGGKEFDSGSWDDKPASQKETYVPKGFARFTDSTGNERQLVLGNDEKWFMNQEGSN